MTKTKPLNPADLPSPAPARPRRSRYHHGDLRAALLEAAETELIEHGIERFSLRGVAKRAGVSHAAPAHHFGDITGLLTALAALGLERLREAAFLRLKEAGPDVGERMIAAALGYIDFATEQPALFRLIFISERPDRKDPGFAAAYDRAFSDARAHICGQDQAACDKDPRTRELMRAAWSMIHGVASLMVAGSLRSISDLPQPERDRAVAAIMQRVI